MSKKKLSAREHKALLTALGTEKATLTQLDVLISKGYVPARLKWQPDLCIIRGKDRILVHILVSSEFPAYLETAILQLGKPRFKRTYVLLLGQDIVTEAEEGMPPPKILAPIIAANVAEKALELGCALAFESEQMYLPPGLRQTVKTQLAVR